MDPCNVDRVTILRYLAKELRGPQLEEFSLKNCTKCGAYLEAEQRLSRLLHRARPLFFAPVALRSHLSTTLVEHTAPKRAPRRRREPQGNNTSRGAIFPNAVVCEAAVARVCVHG
jgi:hypothetical protein